MKKGILSTISFILIILTLALVFYEKDVERKPTNFNLNTGGTLIVGITNDIDSFNPLFGESSLAKEITHLMLLGLADLNEKSEFVGELAEAWERSEDYKKITYHLRKNAFWSDGVQITAEDVKFRFDLLGDTLVASPDSWLVDFIKSVIVIDSFTVEIEFTKPYPDQIFDTAGELVPKHIFENVDRKSIRSHNFGQNPLSSGPFKLKTWVKQQFIELVPNEKYFGERPKLDRVIFKVVPDKTNLILQLQTGEIDMMIGVEPDQVARIKEQNPALKVYPISGRTYYYIGYNEKYSQFSSVKVRQGLTMAINRQQLIDATLQGFGKPCTGPVPPLLSWAHNDLIKPLPFDQNMAQKILAEEGWTDTDGNGWIDKNGKEFSFVLKTNAGNQVKSDLAVIVQNQLKKVGIKVELQSIEWTTFQDQLREKDFESYVGGWNAALNVDPTPIFHSSSKKLFNYVSYSNPVVDKLIENGREELDREKAAQFWMEMQEKIYQDQPYTFLFWKDKIVAVHSRFKNVTPIPLSMFYGLENWYEERSLSE